MGKEKTTQIQDTQQQTTFERSPQEKESMQLQLDLQKALQPGMLDIAESQTDVINRLLTGSELPGQLSGMFGGITPELTAEMSQEAVKDLLPSFQQSGILDSGVAASIAGRTAGDIRRQSAQFNLANRLSLLNAGLTGGGQQQQLGVQAGISLGSQFASGRNFTTSNTGSTTTLGMNPFMKSFQTNLGSSFGNELGSPSGTFERMGSGMGSFAAMSSIKYKDNVRPSELDTIQVVKDTDIYEFNYKPELEDIKDRIGIIAEQAPEILTTDNRDKFDMYNAIGVLMDVNKKLIDRVEKLEEVQ